MVLFEKILQILPFAGILFAATGFISSKNTKNAIIWFIVTALFVCVAIVSLEIFIPGMLIFLSSLSAASVFWVMLMAYPEINLVRQKGNKAFSCLCGIGAILLGGFLMYPPKINTNCLAHDMDEDLYAITAILSVFFLVCPFGFGLFKTVKQK
jgi:hypothetical protein